MFLRLTYFKKITFSSFKTTVDTLIAVRNETSKHHFLLIEREGRTGEYWPEVVIVRTEHREVPTKTTEGQYSPVRLEQAR